MTREIKKGLLFILTIFLTHLTYAQNCSCSDNFVWLKETIEKNDAGFQYVINKKGEQEYQKHCDTFAEKVQNITDKEDCAETLLNWLRFFRAGHLWIGLNADANSTKENTTDSVKIKNQFENWETYSYDEKEFSSYISKIKEPGLEGIWTTPPYTIGIKKVKSEYLGFIIEADGIYWRQSQVKFKIKEENGKLAGEYGVMSIPSVKLFKGGSIIAEFIGAKSEAEVKEFLDKNL